jgi:hypothetical protein
MPIVWLLDIAKPPAALAPPRPPTINPLAVSVEMPQLAALTPVG